MPPDDDAVAVAVRALQQQLSEQSVLLEHERMVRQQADQALRDNEESYRALIEQSPGAIFLVDGENRKLSGFNDNAVKLFGYPRETLTNMRLLELSTPMQADGKPSFDLANEKVAAALAGDTNVFEWTDCSAAGKIIPCEVRLVCLPVAGRKMIHVSIVDITAEKKAEVLRAGQSELLELIAKGAPLKETLSRLMLLIEGQSEGVLCSTLLLDEDGLHIRLGAAPSLPDEYSIQLDGLAIGPGVGSCGSAMFHKKQVIVTDIMQDPLWAPYKGLVAGYGYRACWSTPIFLNQNMVLGAFAMYYCEVRSPGPDDMKLIGVATHIAGIAIERTRREAELSRHREHLEELVDLRTAEVTGAKERTEQANLALSLANQELASALNNLSITQEELVRRDKLAALGSMVAGVAHELNTPIGNSLVVASTLADQTRILVNSYTTGIKRSILESYMNDATGACDILERSLHRAADLVSSFKQVAVDQASSQRRLFRLDEYIEEVLLTLRISFKQTAFVVESHIQQGLGMDSYPGPLGQVVTNLVNNALIHGFEGRDTGTILISAQESSTGWIELIVKDDGIGIQTDNQKRIYDPFFTTKRNVGGTGLGLHITHNIVTGILGGRIRFQSEVGLGTTFFLSLPLTAPQSFVEA